MKKIVIGVLGLCLLVGIQITSAQSLDQVVDRMYEYDLTKYSAIEAFRPDDDITRGEISKFFSAYAELIGMEEIRSSSACLFEDIASYDYTLRPTIIQACKYGLIKGFEGQYFPTNGLTEAEAVTVVIRSLDGQQDEMVNPWWREYYDLAKEKEILDSESLRDLEKDITRQKVARWLYRAYHLTKADQANRVDQAEELENDQNEEDQTEEAEATTELASDVLYQVVGVTDGDTFDVSTLDGTVVTVRMLGIDAPEVGDQGYAEAKNELTDLIADQKVKLAFDAEAGKLDAYERWLAYVFHEDLFVNLYMVEEGLARQFGDEEYAEYATFKDAERAWLDKEPTRRRYCSEFTTCEEAMSALKAGAYQLDGDGDGVPCESRLCD